MLLMLIKIIMLHSINLNNLLKIVIFKKYIQN